MAIKPVSSRFYLVTTADQGDILEFGPAASAGNVGVFTFEFAPSLDFLGSFKVMGKVFGLAAAPGPFLPIAYRRVNINALASDYAIVADDVVPAAIIQVPANGMKIAMLVTVTQGTCGIYSWDMQGPSAI